MICWCFDCEKEVSESHIRRWEDGGALTGYCTSGCRSIVHFGMTDDQKTVDALLATTVSRLLNAADAANRMREQHRQGCNSPSWRNNDLEYWRQAVVMAEHLQIGGHALTEAHAILLGRAAALTQIGGLPN